MDVWPSSPKPWFSITKEIDWRTLRSQTVSGISRRRATWLRPLHRFSVHLGALSERDGKAEATKLYNFYMAQLGGYRAFKFQFPGEGTWEGQPTRKLSDDGTTAVFQAQVKYGGDYENPVVVDQKLLVPGTINVYIDGALQDPSSYTLDEDEGTITMSSTTGTVTADYQRYYKCVFRDDTMSLELFQWKLWRTGVVLQEVDYGGSGGGYSPPS